VSNGAEIRYVEANHRDQLFQHNKFLVMSKNGQPFSAFTGAGNLSQAAFTRNGENFYLIKEPKAVGSFAQQYEYMWSSMATPPDELPVTWATKIAGDRSWPTWSGAVLAEKRGICP
jgi:phosphatidylserine/phosphatidylglycerophosphate/cardiolipin synthase-like enzyme